MGEADYPGNARFKRFCLESGVKESDSDHFQTLHLMMPLDSNSAGFKSAQTCVTCIADLGGYTPSAAKL